MDGLFPAGLGDDPAMRVDDATSAEIDVFGIIAGAVDANDIRPSFRWPGLQQRNPVAFAGEGPVGDDRNRFAPR